MDCTGVKTLRGTQVGTPRLVDHFMVPVTLHGKVVDALIDTGCGRTVVKQAID